MSLKLKKVAEPTNHRFLTEYQVLNAEGVVVARLVQRETCKTGFKRGVCVGQVPTKAWFVYLATEPSREHGRGTFGPLWYKRADALAEIEKMLGAA